MAYNPGQVLKVLEGIQVRVASETATEYLCYCPYHHNMRTPAFAINKHSGLFKCFNGNCNREGNLERLVMDKTKRDRPAAMRYIAKHSTDTGASLADFIQEMFVKDDEELRQFPQTVVDDLAKQFWKSSEAQEYMRNRGFDDETLRYFDVGFSAKQGDLIVYPVYEPAGRFCVGVVGRSIQGKRFKNSTDLPRNKVLFNLHNARKESNRVIIVESGFDAMRIHQAGYPNVIAMLGSTVSQTHISLLNRNFTEAVLFTDNDEAGMKLRKTLSKNLSLGTLHAAIDCDIMYPDGDPAPKDAGDLSIQQIKAMIDNAISSVEFELLVNQRG